MIVWPGPVAPRDIQNLEYQKYVQRMSIHHSFHLSAIFLVSLITSHVTQGTDLPLIPTASNITLGNTLECTRSRIGRLRPLFKHCAAAIRQIPTVNLGVGRFHRYVNDDGFRLPLVETYDTCTVAIDVISETDYYTWLGLSSAATQLCMACSDDEARPTRSGGWTMAGIHGNIKVSLKRVDSVGEVNITNSTMAEE